MSVMVLLVLERYRERLSDRRVEVILGNVAVIPCTAVSRSVPAAHTQFEFNSARLRMTSKSRDRFSLPVLLCSPTVVELLTPSRMSVKTSDLNVETHESPNTVHMQ